MTIDDLTNALQGLATERLQRLADRLEREPGLTVTVGTWRPQCPMVLAGYEPTSTQATSPEERFAKVWDRFAASTPASWLPVPHVARQARRRDVQRLLRATNAVLAARVAAGAAVPAEVGEVSTVAAADGS